MHLLTTAIVSPALRAGRWFVGRNCRGRILEGVVRISIFMGGGTTPNRSVVQSAGWGYRAPM
jgi:hypothetical protein